MEDEFDHVTIGYGDEKKVIPVIEGEGKWKEYLLERFPEEKDGIEKYFKLVEEVKDFEVLFTNVNLCAVYSCTVKLSVRFD